MPLIHLPHRVLLAVTGEEAGHFLEGLVTSQLPDDRSVVGSALLTPQGKLMFSFLISRTSEGFLMECDVQEQADLIKRLTLYKLRAKVAIVPDDRAVYAGLDAAAPEKGFIDQRHSEMGVRCYGEAEGASEDPSGYQAQRAALGVLEGPEEILAGQDFPHDVALDLTGAVSFSKGCFVGQEVVSRVKHRGTARRRPILVKGEGLEAGIELFAGDRGVGTIRLANGNKGVAVVRVDHLAGKDGRIGSPDGAVATVAAPPYATYSLERDDHAD
jgi:hypothetical protein